ncbi:hypothetical protein GIB67_028395, partial [Kingdonia uniflora]
MREEVRNHTLTSLQRCLMGVVDGVNLDLPQAAWLQCFDMVVFTLLDDLLEILQNHFTKDYRNIEGTLVLAMKLLSKRSALGGDSLWELTWLHVNNINPSLQCEVFPDLDSENAQQKHNKIEGRRQSGVIESVDDEYGDCPRPLPLIKELKKATDITNRKDAPSWVHE